MNLSMCLCRPYSAVQGALPYVCTASAVKTSVSHGTWQRDSVQDLEKLWNDCSRAPKGFNRLHLNVEFSCGTLASSHEMDRLVHLTV